MKKKYSISFIEEPDVINPQELSEICGGLKDVGPKCSCHCFINVNTQHNCVGKETKLKLYEKVSKGSFCIIVTVAKPSE